MNLDVSESYGLVLSNVFNGIGIKTDQGIFGIAQRDGGIEVTLDGDLVFSSTEGPKNTTPAASIVNATFQEALLVLPDAEVAIFEHVSFKGNYRLDAPNLKKIIIRQSTATEIMPQAPPGVEVDVNKDDIYAMKTKEMTEYEI